MLAKYLLLPLCMSLSGCDAHAPVDHTPISSTDFASIQIAVGLCNTELRQIDKIDCLKNLQDRIVQVIPTESEANQTDYLDQ